MTVVHVSINLGRTRLALALLAGITYGKGAIAQRWADEESDHEPSKVTLSDYDLELAAEYRTVALRTKALDSYQDSLSLVEQRLRVAAALVDPNELGLFLSADLLDGSLWGTAGSSAGDPIWWAADQDGLRRVGVAYSGAGDTRDPLSYRVAAVPAEAVVLRHLYGQLPTPVGVVRIGRQPVAEGNSILYADGQGRPNRFGYGRSGVFADGVSLTSNLRAGFDSVTQATADRGVLLTGFVQRLASAGPAPRDDAVGRAGARIRLLAPLPTIAQHFDALAEASYGWHTQSSTENVTLRAALEVRSGAFSSGGETFYVSGQTNEMAAYWAVLRGEPSARQRVEQWGARGVVRWDTERWTGYLELDYASGDGDPSPRSSLTRAYFAPDARVGLLLFPHVLAHQTARSQAAADQALAAAGAPAGSAAHLGTAGAFTNAVALFPQFDLRPLEKLVLRWGVLVAWTPEGLVDPVTSSAPSADGRGLNPRGGRAGHFYGVEFDGRASWQASRHFVMDLEGALLSPGDALQDARGEASVSALAQARASFLF